MLRHLNVTGPKGHTNPPSELIKSASAPNKSWQERICPYVRRFTVCKVGVVNLKKGFCWRSFSTYFGPKSWLSPRIFCLTSIWSSTTTSNLKALKVWKQLSFIKVFQISKSSRICYPSFQIFSKMVLRICWFEKPLFRLICRKTSSKGIFFFELTPSNARVHKLALNTWSHR